MTRRPDFVDTNVLIYAFSQDRRSTVAERLLRRGCCASVQVLNEFATVARRKLAMSWDELETALDDLRLLLAPIAPLDLDLHRMGFELARRRSFSIYDAMIVAAALRLGCETLWSEDMQDGLVLDGLLTIRNPF